MTEQEIIKRVEVAQIFDGEWRKPNMDDPVDRAVMQAYERALRRSMEKVSDHVVRKGS